MKQPIKASDLCTVISGSSGIKSPNIGLIVEVVSLVFECSQLGRIWRCKAEFADRIEVGKTRCPPGHADFAQDWLKKIEPDTPLQELPLVAETME